MCSSGSLLPELLGKPDENSFGAPDVAKPIRVFVLDHFADELRAAFAEPGERIVDVLHGEHDAQVTESVHRGTAVIGDPRRREESGHLEPAVTVRRTHHGNLDAHVAQSSDAICPVSFDWGAPLELEAEFGEELNGGVDVFYHDADVVHTLDRHDVSLASNGRHAQQPRGLSDLPPPKSLPAPRSAAADGSACLDTRTAIKPPWPRRFPAPWPRRAMQFGTGRSSGELVEKEIRGGNPAAPDDDEIS